jgi:hypothetical protein
MWTWLTSGYRRPLTLLLGSVLVFFSGLLFAIPGICETPGLLGHDWFWPAFVCYLGGIAGSGIACFWIVVVLLTRILRRDSEVSVDLTLRNP